MTVDVTEMTGLELLRALLPHMNSAPNIGSLLGMEVVTLEEGEVSFALTTQPAFANPLGAVHGGICATLLDSVMSCAVHTTLPAGDTYTTLELKVNYIAGASTDGVRLIASGRTIHVGRSTATAEGEVRDESGKLIAHGTTTCLVMRAP